MTQTRYFSSVAEPTTLSSNVASTATSIPAEAITGYPNQFPYRIALDYGTALEELCDVTSVAGLVFNVTRAVDGTSASAHNLGAEIRHVSSAQDFNEANAHINSSMGVHGLQSGSSVVGTTDTQTLTNKTIVGGTYENTVVGTSAVGNTNLTIQEIAGQTADPFQVLDSAEDTLAGIHADGTVFSNKGMLATGAIAGDVVLGTKVSGDAVDRFTVEATGQMGWGGGATSTDVNLYRPSPGLLKTDDSFTVGQSLTANLMTTAGMTNTGNETIAGNLTVTGTATLNGPFSLGGGVGTVYGTYKASNTSVANQATPQLDSDFTSPSLAPGVWIIDGYFPNNGATAGGLSIQFGFSGTETVGVMQILMPPFGGTINQANFVPISFGTILQCPTFGVSTNIGAHIKGFLNVTAAGTFNVNWAQAVSNATPTTVDVGAHFTLTRIH